MKSIADFQEIVNATRYSNNKVAFVFNVYQELEKRGYEPVILNDKYIEVDGADYQFIHHPSDCSYTVKEM